MNDMCIEIRHETVVICAIILFLAVDLFFIDGIIKLLLGQIYNQQDILTGMINSNPANASLYTNEIESNEIIDIIAALPVLVFLGYISWESFGLLKKIVEVEKDKDANNKQNPHHNNKRPK